MWYNEREGGQCEDASPMWKREGVNKERRGWKNRVRRGGACCDVCGGGERQWGRKRNI